MRNILVITDMDSDGSGYRNICVPLFTELSKLDYQVKIIGFSNRGEEHNYPFSILPTNTLEEACAMAGNLCVLWNPDVIVVAMDLPIQAKMYQTLQPLLKREGGNRKYVCITPMENGPLCLEWAAPLFSMDGVFFISELGKQEALKVGVKAEHLQIGVDTVLWRPPFPEEKKQLRDGLGIPQDAFVVLTVADNQERKNLWAAIASICLLTHRTMTYSDLIDISAGKRKMSEFPKTDEKARYILVTREDSPVGWRLRELARQYDLNQEYIPFNRGMPQKDLWGLYAVADAYLQTSKAEGLGLPVLDAMCMRIPVVATDTGALSELLYDRGYLVEPEYTFTDVWGNSRRDMISILGAKNALWIEYSSGKDEESPSTKMKERAYEWVKTRTWDIPAHQLDTKIREMFNDKTGD